MGWANNDKETVEQSKISLVHLRQAFYTLKTTVARINHTEKREAIQDCIKMVQSEIDTIQMHLDR
jgi:hypothetical protein